MEFLVLYESMYGNTHLVAERVGAGLATRGTVRVLPVHDATPDDVTVADLVVVGGPTHAHGMSSHFTRDAAIDAAHQPDAKVELDPDAQGPGVRDLFKRLGHVDHKPAAAFDTRFDAAAAITGRASRGIVHRLRHHGFTVLVDPESFLVDKQNHLEAGEATRAEAWGAMVARQLVTT